MPNKKGGDKHKTQRKIKNNSTGGDSINGIFWNSWYHSIWKESCKENESERSCRGNGILRDADRTFGERKIKNPAYKMIAEIEDTFHINMNQELESLQGNKKNNEMEEILKINKWRP